MNKFIITLLMLSASCLVKAQIAIKAETIHTVSGKPIKNGVVLVKNGKIENVGTGLSIPSGYKIYETKVVTPGLIDSRSLVGISGALNIPTDQDQLDKTSPIQPELRAIDAYNPDESLVEVLRDHGITTIHTGHGVGALVSGQTMIAKTKAGTAESVTIQPMTMLAMTLEPSVGRNFSSPGTSAKQMAMIRAELIKAQAYQKKQEDKDESKRPAKDLKLEALSKMLKGDVKALITVNASKDIMTAIRLAKEFNLKLVLNGAAEAYRLIPQIKEAKAEVILHATMARNGGDMVNMTRESAALLTAAGIPVSIEGGYESYVPKTRIVLFEAGQAMVHGLSFDEALKTITLNPAKLLGIDQRVGSIEKGKDADLVLFDGDPFEYLTTINTVFIDGEVVSGR
ncbi:MAG TPA: amidohydrolase family protein [Gelidibacter sp.]|uniref:amidohydrolase family protein n=1 Tax=Gelidibacter sp. TaxID=2018083 RepID=UPI002BE80703|nr:amidohydrolase family protein [Gelidibacter sp.]HXJ98053.1 amidohydrolase family protein [Gelidibacter sp.]